MVGADRHCHRSKSRSILRTFLGPFYDLSLFPYFPFLFAHALTCGLAGGLSLVVVEEGTHVVIEHWEPGNLCVCFAIWYRVVLHTPPYGRSTPLLLFSVHLMKKHDPSVHDMEHLIPTPTAQVLGTYVVVIAPRTE